jgi:hypothetical protein
VEWLIEERQFKEAEPRAWLYKATVAHGFRKMNGSRVVEALDTGKKANRKKYPRYVVVLLSCTHESMMEGDIKVAIDLTW